MNRLKNKVALITGGARGLGASIANHFFNEGAEVILCDININDATKKLRSLMEKHITWMFQTHRT